MENKKLLFKAEAITKSFHGTKALKNAELEIFEGEIVGLVGENGAGKSTLLKIIIGAQPPTSGRMLMHDLPFAPQNPMEANAAGVGMVFQEQSLVLNLNVGQNLFFGKEREYSKNGVIRWKKMYADAQALLAEVGLTDVSPKTKVYDLNFATRQMLEIAKVIHVTRTKPNRKCLILLDEPTSVLNDEEVSRLFMQMRRIVSQGHSVIFVSHRLDEVLKISDRIYVYKDGLTVESMSTSEASEARLYEAMVGRETPAEYYKVDQQREAEPEVVLETVALGMKGVFQDVGIQLHRGEVLGICGVVGSGKEEICSILCGDERPTKGVIRVKGKEMRFRSPAQALRNGILMVPKERLAEGIVLNMSIAGNIALSNASRLSKGPLVPFSRVVAQANHWIGLLRIKTTGYKQLLMNLSGGNQQKVVFARALASNADIIILNHPTRGVDVGAKEEIYALMRDIVGQGKAVILLGDTLDECIAMSNRILVMRDGLITGSFDAPKDAKPSQVELVSKMM